jgi:hypothetical protein
MPVGAARVAAYAGPGPGLEPNHFEPIRQKLEPGAPGHPRKLRADLLDIGSSLDWARCFHRVGGVRLALGVSRASAEAFEYR